MKIPGGRILLLEFYEVLFLSTIAVMLVKTLSSHLFTPG